MGVAGGGGGGRESPQAKEHGFWGLEVRLLDSKLARLEDATNIDYGELKLNSAKQEYGPRVAKPSDFSRKTGHLDFYVKFLNL